MRSLTLLLTAVVAFILGTPTPASAAPVSMQAWVTGYSIFDNTPPGSAAISHPVIHDHAGGRGTWEWPITVAVGHSLATGKDVLDWKAGTRFYVPKLRRYFIVEDTCGDGPHPELGACHVGYPRAAVTWLDVWVGGSKITARQAERCMSAMTGVTTVIRNPPKGLPVIAGEICH